MNGLNGANGGRQLPSWISGFVQYTEGVQSPEIFRKWSAITTLAAAMERKVWIRSQGRNLYPNLYVLLCGPPGVGKNNAIVPARELFAELKDHKLASINVSSASIIDELSEAIRRIVQPMNGTPYIDFNALFASTAELGAFIKGYDMDLIDGLTYLYDGIPYTERKRSKDIKYEINNPCLTLLAGTTPGHMGERLPPIAWEQGFLARMIIVYSGFSTYVPLDLMEERKPVDTALRNALVHDLDAISKVYRKIMFSPEAAALLSAWHEGGCQPAPEHPRLMHYSTRRVAHILKLCSIAAIDRGSLIIEAEDYQNALGWLLQAEYHMPDLFKAMTSGGEAAVMEEAWFFVYTHYIRENTTPVAEHRLVEFLRSKLPGHAIMRAIEIMRRSQMITGSVDMKTGEMLYVPREKKI